VHQAELEMQNEELRQRQEELETSRAKYFDFYNLSPVGYFTISGQGLILEANLTAANLLGMERSLLLGQPFTRLIAAEDQDVYYLFHKQLFETGKPQSCELRMALQAGARFWARLEATVFEDTESGESASHIVVSAITERKKAEEELQRFFNLVPDMVCIASTDGRFLKINPMWEATLGYTEQEILSTPFLDFIHPDDRDPTMQEVARQIGGSATIRFVNRYRCKDGGYKWLEWMAPPAVDRTLLFAAARDITGRKLVEEKLRESEERFRTLVETADDAIILLDMDFNRIYENEASWAGLGYTFEEWKKSGSWQGRVHPDDIDLIKEKTADLLKTGASASKYRIRHKSGHYVTRLAKSKVIHSDGKPVAVLAILRDVTEMEMAEKTLRESERKYRQLMEQASEGIFVVDQKTRYLDVNPAGLEMVGYSLEELRGMTITDLMPPGEFEKVPSRFSEILSGKTVVSERTLRRKDGSLFQAELTAKLMPDGNVLATKRDITDRKRLEDALGESEKKYRSLFESAGDAIFLADAVTGNLVDCNRKAEELVGRSKNEIIGMHQSQLHPPDKAEEYKRLFKNHIETGRNISEDVVVVHKDGRHIHVGIRVAVFEIQGRLLALGIFRDITERVSAEKALITALKEAELANKAKSVFLSSMSHEIRTPLTSVIGFSQLLVSDAEHPLSDFQKQLLGKVMNSGGQLLELVNSALDLAKIESGDIEMSIEAVNMNYLATMALTSSAHLAKEYGVNLIPGIPEDGCHVIADAILLRQVLTNLLSNAIKYNKKGGETILSWKPFDENKVRISISDEGGGISKDNIKNLYKPFDRLGMEGRNIKGFGVGLTIVKRLVESMGGEVGVESEVGKGSTFYIDLPGGKKRE
jgi:PAS domain S-box-containing protein